MIQKQLSTNFLALINLVSSAINIFICNVMQDAFFSDKTRLIHLMLNWMPFQLFWALQEEAITSSLENLLEELAVTTPTDKNKQQTLYITVYSCIQNFLKRSSFFTSSITSQQRWWTSKGYCCAENIPLHHINHNRFIMYFYFLTLQWKFYSYEGNL